ncbi:MAG: DNA polymerase III subunit alpha [Chlamydiia bacterium]
MTVELHAQSHYSFLGGASSPEQLACTAASRGIHTIALTDRHGFYGAPAFVKACRKVGIKPLLGAEMVMGGSDPVVILCRSDFGYQQLSRWITAAYREGEKGAPHLPWDQMAETPHDQLTLMLGAKGSILAGLLEKGADLEAIAYLDQVRCHWSGEVVLELTHHGELADERRCKALQRLSTVVDLPLVIGGQVRYATHEEGPLWDVLQAIRQRVPLEHAELPANHQAFLQDPHSFQRRWKEYPEAIRATEELAARCELGFDFRDVRFPAFPTPPGESTDDYLAHLCWEVFPRFYGQEHRHQLQEELKLIQQLGLSGYFLIVWDLVAYARRERIPVQGRGSAANSMVAYLLGITPVDPVRHRLFLGRFLHAGMKTVPDIDLDFASERGHDLPSREKVIQYVYQLYGADHVAMVSTVITFQERSAIREVGSVMGMPPLIIDKLARLAGHRRMEEALEEVKKEPTMRAWIESPLGYKTCMLIEQILGVPRHLGIHVGGMLIGARPLAHVVPLEPARMEGRVVCQWDKDQVEEAGLIKVDLLGLGMLGVIREAALHAGIDISQIPLEDPDVYQMLGRADTLGVFQVESRAQMNSLPLTQPKNLSELAIQIALIRPGPLQGQMVSPYIRRKRGEEPVTYLHPCTRPFLEETLGVILFQEQVLQVAMVAAGFTAEQADDLRRSISRKRSLAAVQALEQQFLEGAGRRGIAREEATRIFRTLEGFALYGFCKSHALAFAHLTYQSAYLKCRHPAALLAALLNHQPMGFYPPEILIHDAQRHGVVVLPVDLHRSDRWCSIENGAVRLGFQLVRGWRSDAFEEIQRRPFPSFRDFLRRTTLLPTTVEALIHAGAFDALGPRRHHLWQLWHGLRMELQEPDLFGVPEAPELPHADWMELREEESYAQGLSLKPHPLQELRSRLRLPPSRSLEGKLHGERVALIGRVIVRQRPPTAKGFAFLTLDDEEGLWNVVVPPELYRTARQSYRLASYLKVEGVLQRRGQVLHVRATSLISFDAVMG